MAGRATTSNGRHMWRRTLWENIIDIVSGLEEFLVYVYAFANVDSHEECSQKACFLKYVMYCHQLHTTLLTQIDLQPITSGMHQDSPGNQQPDRRIRLVGLGK